MLFSSSNSIPPSINTPNQFFILVKLKDFSSATRVLNELIFKICYRQKSFLIMVKVYLADEFFILVDDALNFGDLLGWVKGVTFLEIFDPSFTSLAILESESKCCYCWPLHLCESHAYKILQILICKHIHGRKTWTACRSYLLWNDILTVGNRVDHHILFRYL